MVFLYNIAKIIILTYAGVFSLQNEEHHINDPVPLTKTNLNFTQHLRDTYETFQAHNNKRLSNVWHGYKKKFNKTYEGELDSLKMLTFFVNRLIIKYHNSLFLKGIQTYKLNTNKFVDWTIKERKKLLGFRSMLNEGKHQNVKKLCKSVLPDSIDWRKNGYVTPVKDQDKCGSCWAFSAVGALEGQHKRATNKLVALSEQNIIDCSYGYNMRGCWGGYMDGAFQYVKDYGLDTENSYPYEGLVEHDCLYNKSNVGSNETGYIDLPTQDEEQLKIAVATIGPISAAINADLDSFFYYKFGVYNDKNCKNGYINLNHGILVVGYGTDPIYGDYWLVKNSWGKDWGEDGYIRMARNQNNLCGIANNASYPIVLP